MRVCGGLVMEYGAYAEECSTRCGEWQGIPPMGFALVYCLLHRMLVRCG
jgi:hypothetical protein